MQIYTGSVPYESKWITANKLYNVEPHPLHVNVVVFTDDDGYRNLTSLTKSAHLDGKDWQVIGEDVTYD